jgi:small subunit ribosomal protein S17
MRTDEVTAQTRGLSKTKEGVVVSNKMQKTVVVVVEMPIRHRRYGKYIKRRKRYVAHDAENECQVGDRVLLAESRPLSRTKRWRVRSVVERAA